MSAPVIQGWCPGALRPMLSGDGFVVRVRPHLGLLTSAQALEIARLSRAYGNGLIDLSARANVQLRGVTEQSHAPLIEGLQALGLIDETAQNEARRNIVLAPFWQKGDAAPRLAQALETALAAPDAPALPGKFGFAVDCGEVPVLRDISTDIRIERDAAGELLVIADGASHGLKVSEAEAIPAALDLARWFLASGGAPMARGRMRKHLGKVALPEHFAQHPHHPENAEPPGPGLHPLGALIGFAFGQMQAEALEALARLGNLRITPWRMLLVENLATRPDRPELITRPDDPLRRVIACTGAPGCGQALQATRDLARALAPLLPENSLLHVSGCAKGCAHPGAAPLTLVATPQGFDLIRDGNAAAPPALIGLPPEPATILKAL